MRIHGSGARAPNRASGAPADHLNNNFSSLSDLKVNFSYIHESKFEGIKNPKFKLKVHTRQKLLKAVVLTHITYNQVKCR